MPYGFDEHAFFDYETFDEARKLKRAFFPKRPEEFASGRQRFKMPKVQGEIRLVGVDLASSAAKGSDNSSFVLCRLIPSKKYYRRQLVYAETHNGVGAIAQALRIRQLMTDFEADTLIMDFRNLGNSIFNIMTDTIHDDVRGIDYPPITVAYHDTIANKYDEYMLQTIRKDAIPCIYPIHATAELNSQMSVKFKDCLKTGMIEMLITPEEAEKMWAKEIGFSFYSGKEGDYGGRNWLMAPYEQTTALINEALSLAVYVVNGNFKLVEPKKSTKDRIVSLIYLNYYATLLDSELMRGDEDGDFIRAIQMMNRGSTSKKFSQFGNFF